jgi:dTDP-4-dehydrorhamnose reductase
MRILVTGGCGLLGSHVVPELRGAGQEVIAWGREGRGRVELAEAGAVVRALDRDCPEAVIHLAAVSSFEAAYRDPEHARAVNVEATRQIAQWCGRTGRRLLFTSTDAVFDGQRGGYREEDEARPILVYGRTKLEAEGPVLAIPGGLVVRLSLLYGPSRGARQGFFDRSLARLRQGEPCAFFEDEHRTPLDLATAARIVRLLLERRTTGLVHVGGAERLSRFELMRRAARALGIDTGLVRANRQADAPSAEPRPVDVSLDTTRLAALLPDLRRPSVEEALGGHGFL